MEDKRNKRQRQADETKARIQVAALSLFTAKGFENVSVDEIAKMAGCSVGNIYHYFPNKESLTMMITANVDIKYRVIRDKYLGSKDVDIKNRLIEFVGNALEIDSYDDLLYQCFIHSIKYPEQGFLKPHRDGEYFDILYCLVEELCESIGLPEGYTVDEIYRAFVALNRGLLIEWKIEERAFNLPEAGRKQARMYIEGLDRIGEITHGE